MNRVGRICLVIVVLLCAGRMGALAWDAGKGTGAVSLDEEEAQRMFRQSVALGVPEAELRDLDRRCREAGFASAEIRRILGLMTKAKLAGLPHDDLLNKLREGLAKGASPEAVERAVEAKAQVLRRAKSLVDALLTEGRITPNYSLALKVVSDALEAGAAPVDVLCAVRESRSLGQGMPDVHLAFRDVR